MSWVCSRCGETHDGLPDLSFDAPDAWLELEDGDRARSRLDTDLCLLRSNGSERYYVRAFLELPVLGEGQSLGIGAWAETDRRSFERFVDLYDDARRVHEPPFAGSLANRVPGYPDTLGLPGRIETRHVETRPWLVLDEGPHPLAVEQREGIAAGRALELVEPLLHV